MTLVYRYINQEKDDNGNGRIKNDNSWSYRVRLRANAQVNDKTKVTYGISTGNHTFSQNYSADNENDIYTDLANVQYSFGKNWTATVGRYNYVMGGDNAYGVFYGDTFDGAQLKYQSDSFAATAGYGKFKAGDIAGTYDDDGTLRWTVSRQAMANWKASSAAAGQLVRCRRLLQ